MSNDPLRILVVDDEPAQRELIGGFLRKQGHEVFLAGSGAEALARVRAARVDLVLSDCRMPGMSGLDLLREVKAVNPAIPLVLMTAYGTVETAVQAMKEGAADFLTKPLDLEELTLRVARVSEQVRLRSEVRELQAQLVERHRIEGIIGESGRMQEVLALVKRVAPSDATVLIRGESGTGKELIARAIHYNSSRAGGPLVTLNCAALPEQLLESELFGHEKGSFTGAAAAKPGLFEVANGGTLFLDEVGEMSPPMQAKLLTVLDTGEIRRVGGTKSRKVDVRIVAATNKNLEEEVEADRFREDLLFRLNVISLTVPPLRERKEDIALLAVHFLERFRPAGGSPKRLAPAAVELLTEHGWPGNVRELANTLEGLTLLAPGPEIRAEDLPPGIRRSGAAQPAEPVANGPPVAMTEVERRHIIRTLRYTEGKKAPAARILGIDVKTLTSKMRTYDISV